MYVYMSTVAILTQAVRAQRNMRNDLVLRVRRLVLLGGWHVSSYEHRIMRRAFGLWRLVWRQGNYLFEWELREIDDPQFTSDEESEEPEESEASQASPWPSVSF